MKNRRRLLAVGVFAGVVIAVLAAWLCDGRSQRQSVAASTPLASPRPKLEAITARALADPVPVPSVAAAERPQQAAPPSIPIWQHPIDAVLQSPANESQTALILVGMFPRLPAEGQVQAARHIANLLADSDYNSVTPILLNPGTEKEALDVLYSDLMNRPDTTKLHTLLNMVQIQNHPLSEEARSTLTILLGEDEGNDWTKWNLAVDKYVASKAVH